MPVPTFLVSAFVAVFIHILIDGKEHSLILVEAKLDWKHVASLSSDGSYHGWKEKVQELKRGDAYGQQNRQIPVLGVGLNNDPSLLLLRLFYSLDYHIGKTVVVTGTSMDTNVKRELDHITRHFKNVIHRQGLGIWLGVAETWNIIMREVPEAPWMLIVSLDVEFAPGSLERLARTAWADWDKGELDQAFIEYSNEDMSGGYSAFVLSRVAIEKLGYFDENIFPAYYEDTEYDLRVRKYQKTGGRFNRRGYSDVVALHGIPDGNGSLDPRGVISAMTKQESLVPMDEIFKAVHKFIQPYLVRKWDCKSFDNSDWHDTCTFPSPFNGTDNKISYWELNTSLRAEIVDMLVATDATKISTPATNMRTPATKIIDANLMSTPATSMSAIICTNLHRLVWPIIIMFGVLVCLGFRMFSMKRYTAAATPVYSAASIFNSAQKWPSAN